MPPRPRQYHYALIFVDSDGDLVARWESLLGRAGIADDGLLDDLLARYAEPHRRYHGVAHVAAVVRRAEQLATEVGLDHPEAAVLAASFHDAVYDPRAQDNERRSADLAVEALSARGADAALAERVAALVLATADHVPDDDADLDAAVLLDADLAILAAPPDDYDGYAAAVREEYGFVPDDAFRAGRRRVLQSLLSRPLFRTEPMRALEAAARENIDRELRTLDALGD